MDLKNCKAKMILQVDYSSSKNQAKGFFSMNWENMVISWKRQSPLDKRIPLPYQVI